MNKGISIRPSRDLRNNYSQISELCNINPVAITVNGREDTVIMSHKDFVNQQNLIEELKARLELYAHLTQAEDDIKLGRVISSDEVYDNILKEIESFNI